MNPTNEGRCDADSQSCWCRTHSEPLTFCRSELERVVGELHKAVHAARISSKPDDNYDSHDDTYQEGEDRIIAAFDERAKELGIEV